MILALSGKIGSGKDTVCNVIQYLTRPDIYRSGDVNNDMSFETWCSLKGVASHHPMHKFQNKKWAYKLKLICSIISGKSIENFEDQDFKNSLMDDEWKKVILSEGKDIILDMKDGIHLLRGRGYKVDEEDFKSWTYRELLQRVGTEAMREQIHPNVWINALMVDYKPKYIGEQGQELMVGNYTYYKEGKDKNAEVVKEVYPNWIITDTRFPNEAKAVKAKSGKLIRVNRWITGYDTGKTEHISETALDDYKDWDYELDNSGTIEDLIENVKKILIIEKII